MPRGRALRPVVPSGARGVSLLPTPGAGGGDAVPGLGAGPTTVERRSRCVGLWQHRTHVSLRWTARPPPQAPFARPLGDAEKRIRLHSTPFLMYVSAEDTGASLLRCIEQVCPFPPPPATGWVPGRGSIQSPRSTVGSRPLGLVLRGNHHTSWPISPASSRALRDREGVPPLAAARQKPIFQTGGLAGWGGPPNTGAPPELAEAGQSCTGIPATL